MLMRQGERWEEGKGKERKGKGGEARGGEGRGFDTIRGLQLNYPKEKETHLQDTEKQSMKCPSLEDQRFGRLAFHTELSKPAKVPHSCNILSIVYHVICLLKSRENKIRNCLYIVLLLLRAPGVSLADLHQVLRTSKILSALCGPSHLSLAMPHGR